MRFARQTILPGFGTAGQEKLARAKVLVIGAGGLGCPILLHLAAAGVGTLGIADGDSISESNLNRQTLFGVKDVGKPKATTAASHLQEKYPDIQFEVIPEYLTNANALEIISRFDMVLDGSDNFATRYMINDACVLLMKPLIVGAIFQYEGQIAVFNVGAEPINYRDVYPHPPREHEIPNCAETGVLGVLPGMIGILQATEAIKLISGVGELLNNRILFYNLRNTSFFEVEATPNPDARKQIPQSVEAFREKDYAIQCGAVETMKWEQALDWAQRMKNSLIIDVRGLEELPKIDFQGIAHIPQTVLENEPEMIAEVEHVFLFCQAGVRSLKTAAVLKKVFPEKTIVSIEGGILDPTSPINSEYHAAKA